MTRMLVVLRETINLDMKPSWRAKTHIPPGVTYGKIVTVAGGIEKPGWLVKLKDGGGGGG